MIGGNLPDGFQGVADAVKKDDACECFDESSVFYGLNEFMTISK